MRRSQNEPPRALLSNLRIEGHICLEIPMDDEVPAKEMGDYSHEENRSPQFKYWTKQETLDDGCQNLVECSFWMLKRFIGVAGQSWAL